MDYDQNGNQRATHCQPGNRHLGSGFDGRPPGHGKGRDRAGELDLILVATTTPDMAFPSTACIVQAGLGAYNAAAFDLEAACSGFLYGLAIGEQFISSGVYETVLIIGAEVLSKIVNWSDRNTCVLFGDGAGACVLRPVTAGKGILSHYLGADGRGVKLLQLPAGGSRLPASAATVEQGLHYIEMQGAEVFKFAVRIMGERPGSPPAGRASTGRGGPPCSPPGQSQDNHGCSQTFRAYAGAGNCQPGSLWEYVGRLDPSRPGGGGK